MSKLNKLKKELKDNDTYFYSHLGQTKNGEPLIIDNSTWIPHTHVCGEYCWKCEAGKMKIQRIMIKEEIKRMEKNA